MKQFLLILALAVVAYFAYANYGSKSEKPRLSFSSPAFEKPLRIIYYQDISHSIRIHGVEVVTSVLFKPFFELTERTIELNYGVISSSSARKLLTVNLPAFTAKKPIKPDFNKYTITDKSELAKAYQDALERYQNDSARYFQNRHIVIGEFCKKVDSLTSALNVPSEQGSTDITTAVDIADRQLDSSRNYLVLNSDGLDSRSYHKAKLVNKVTVLLVNAGRRQKTSLDSIDHKTLQSSEQAIQFILSQ